MFNFIMMMIFTQDAVNKQIVKEMQQKQPK